jgi:hypothetical protein
MFCKYIVYIYWQGQRTDWQTTDPTSRQRGRPHRQDCNFLKIKINKFLVIFPRWGTTPRQTDWLSVAMWLWLELNQFCTGVCEERTWAEDRGISIVGFPWVSSILEQMLSWFPEFHVALRASHAALPLVTSKFRPNVALPMLVQFSQ